jgi:hypothetical protein
MNQEMQLARFELIPNVRVFGELRVDFLDKDPFCFTCEDPPRKQKIFGKTGIPAGRYEVLLTWSPKFKRFMLLVDKVPEFVGIRLHGGKNEQNSEGCPILGFQKLKDGVANPKGRSAEIELIQKLTGMFVSREQLRDPNLKIKLLDKTYLTIINGF